MAPGPFSDGSNGGTVTRRILALGFLAGLLGRASCLDQEGPKHFTTRNSCVRGQTLLCKCTSGVQNGLEGFLSCDTDEGRFSAECHCKGCTIWPDCSRCNPHDCYATCYCQTGGLRDLECRATCETLVADSGKAPPDAAPPAPVCNPAACPVPPQFPIQVTQCCSQAGKCGFSFGGATPNCTELNQPGTPDPSCPTTSLGGAQQLPGCCRPSGLCGALVTQPFAFGCIDTSSALGGGGGAPPPQACSQVVR